MDNQAFMGRLLAGTREAAERAIDRWRAQPVDWDGADEAETQPAERFQRTIERPQTVRGPGTFFGRSIRTVMLEPTDTEGWWLDRSDLPDSLPVRVSIRNVWTTGKVVSNIVLRSGSPHNYVRMVEHIVALKAGLGIDNLMIRIDSGDPPLFEHGSRELVQALDAAGERAVGRPANYVTVKERVTLPTGNGGFIVLAPARPDRPRLHIDCAIDFKTAIRRQRIRFVMTPERFRYGAQARTNTTAMKMLYCRTIGKLFADVRNLGYTTDNILVAGRFGYYNTPRMIHNGKSLEAVWHRAALDLPAALALIEEGRFVGDVISYKAGHATDVQLVRALYRDKLLARLPVG